MQINSMLRFAALSALAFENTELISAFSFSTAGSLTCRSSTASLSRWSSQFYTAKQHLQMQRNSLSHEGLSGRLGNHRLFSMSAAEDSPISPLESVVCYDGGCVAADQDLMHELEKDLKELSDTENRLRMTSTSNAVFMIQNDGEKSPEPDSQAPPAQEDSIVGERLAGRNGPTVWTEFGALAAQTKGVNLGQGFPNWSPPDFVVNAAVDAISRGGAAHQYTRSAGHMPLVALLAARYSMHLGREVNPETEVAVTVGASQALFLSLQALLRPGDEVILMEPFFDLYLGQVTLAGGRPVFVPLTPTAAGAWELDVGLLRAAVTPRTRVLVLNSPHNPTGKVFSRREMEAIAEVVRSNPRLVVLSDEVYKYIIHAPPTPSLPGVGAIGATPAAAAAAAAGVGVAGGGGGALGSEGHVHFARLPGMWDRTLTLSSAGKTFSVTGWQVGWVIGPSRYMRDIQTLLPFVQFCPSTPMQEAMVAVLKRADQEYEGERSYYDWLRKSYVSKRDKLASALEAAGIIPMKGEGGFFLIGNTRNLQVPQKYMEESTPAMPVMTRDWALCRWLAKEVGVIGIPCSAFYSRDNRHLSANFVRFAFCKTDDTLLAAKERFAALKAARKPAAPV